MHVLISPDSFKGSCSSLQAAEAIAKGVERVYPEAKIDILPVGDGGEGTAEAMVAAAGGELLEATVTGPLGEPVKAFYGLIDDRTAVIEMASASGLGLVPEAERDPLRATTRGTGELMLRALDRGVDEIILGIGGSATNDGGTGMAAALGYRFLDREGRELPAGGGSLGSLASIDAAQADPRLRKVRVRVACDVNNPLTGPSGASAVYGPQKGAGPSEVELLDVALGTLAEVVERELGMDAAQEAGVGAAGGLGYGLRVFCGAELAPGIDIVLDTLDFDERLEGVDLLITGEGKLDGQTAYGKLPVGVAGRAARKGVPVLAIAGDIGEGIEGLYQLGIDAVMAGVPRAMGLQEAMERVHELLPEAAARAMRMIRLGERLC